MKCEKCNVNEATFFYKETVNGKTRSLHLCADCAEKMRAAGELRMEMPDFDTPFAAFPSFFGDLFALPEKTSKRAGAKTCPGCGATWQDIVNLGKARCPECYRAFADELDATVRSMHGNVTHTGRAPQKQRAAHEKENQLADLKKQLKEAIEQEKFEDAAALRDKIHALEQA